MNPFARFTPTKPWSEHSKDPDHWQRFHQEKKSYTPRREKKHAPDMRKDRRYLDDIFKSATEQLKREVGAKHASA